MGSDEGNILNSKTRFEIKRECGSCTLCCKLLDISEFDAPANVWCPKCNPKKGCKIYGDHPKRCKEFVCCWLMGVGAEHERPDKSKVVMKFMRAHQDGVTQLQVYVDKGYPDAWKTPTMQILINKLTEAGGRTIIIYGDKRTAIGNESVLKILEGKILK